MMQLKSSSLLNRATPYNTSNLKLVQVQLYSSLTSLTLLETVLLLLQTSSLVMLPIIRHIELLMDGMPSFQSDSILLEEERPKENIK